MLNFNTGNQPNGGFTSKDNVAYGALLDDIAREIKRYSTTYDLEKHRSDVALHLFEGCRIWTVKAEQVPEVSEFWVATHCLRGHEPRTIICTTSQKFPGSLDVYYPWSNKCMADAKALLAGLEQLNSREQRYEAIDALPPRDDAADQ